MTDALPHGRMTVADIAVYADALLERGDPYGEFIAQALRGGPESVDACERLRRKHEKKWLGPLAHFLEVEYEHGLPRRAELKRTAGVPTSDALAHPLLRTIRVFVTGKTAKTRTGRANVDAYEAFAHAMFAHALQEIDISDGQLVALRDHGAKITALHDVRLLDRSIQTSLRDPRLVNVTWVELRSPAHLFGRVLQVLRDDDGLFARNRPDVVMHFTTSGRDESALLRDAFADLPVRSFLLYGLLRFHRVAGEVQIDEIAPPPPPPPPPMSKVVAAINRELKRSLNNRDEWRVSSFQRDRDDHRVICTRPGYEVTATVAIAPDNRGFVRALLVALAELDVDGSRALALQRDELAARDDGSGIVAMLRATADHPKLDWPGFAARRYSAAPRSNVGRALLTAIPAIFVERAATIVVTACLHDLMDDALVAARHLTERDLEPYGLIRTTARSCRMRGELVVADRFDAVCGVPVSLPPERFR